MVEPLVSIIIPTFNRSQFLGDALDGLIAQTYKHWECWVIDDGSTDHTSKLMENYTRLDQRIKYRKRPDDYSKGANACRNYGLLLSEGSLIAFCDDDDFWLPNKLELQVPIFEDHPNVGVVTGNMEYVNANGIRTGRVIDFSECHGYIFKELLLKNRTSMVTPIVRREVFDQVGNFNVSFKFSEDWEFWRRVGYYYEFYSVSEVMACVRKHDTNTTNQLTGKPIEQYLNYRRLTKSLLEWGKDRLVPNDYKLIKCVEWQRYRILLVNHCPGKISKLSFFVQLFFSQFKEAIRFLYLFVRYEFIKPENTK